MTEMTTLKDWRAVAAGLKPETRLLLDGKFKKSASGKSFPTINPAKNTLLAEVAQGGGEDIDQAVAAARNRFRQGGWSRLAPRARMDVMYRFTDLIEANGDTFAVLDTMDMGKPISEMLAIDIPGSVMMFRYIAECIDKASGSVPATASNALHYIMRQPLGVVGCIVPWNYPLMMAAWKIAPALAAGNSVILKPAEQSPLSALLLGQLFLEAGGPEGVLNVVPGLGEEVGKALALHNDVDKIAFTGSTEVGRLIHVYAGQSNMKRISVECGGKSPQVVLDDVVDLETAVSTAIMCIYGNQGEVCSAGSRLLVDKKIHDEFVDLFTVKAGAMFTLGDPLDAETTMGPLVTQEHQKRVLGFIETGEKEGADCRFGGGVPATLSDGCYVEPTLFTGVSNDMTIAREEIFGPVATVIPVDGVAEATEIANDTIYGLAAGIWTSDLNKAHTMARDLEAGMIWINGYMNGDMSQPWGGWKQSGHGRDKCFQALLDNMQTKSVWVTLDEQ